MSDKSRRTVTTIETHEVLIIRRRAPEMSAFLCAACLDGVRMLTPAEAASRAGVTQRTVYCWIEDGRIHFAETTEGIFVCLAPLAADPG
jgi:excisionase family DNA binding protein